ncbi:MAG TPA: enolase C-terminal domain-like protein, partial [Burkholderiaceae bacterium]|nr:enolase C-terminal domain-like protein [Burkholderiaceae bacterium]
GYTYADAAAAVLIRNRLAPVLHSTDAAAIGARWLDMVRVLRNLGRGGLSAMAVAAVDSALWDLHAKRLSVSLARLLGPMRASIPVYGSGGFVNQSIEQLREQLEGWVQQGFERVKIKVGRDEQADLNRATEARLAIGQDVKLYVDANGAYRPKQALRMAERFAELDVSWFEEPVSSDDLAGLAEVRDRAPPEMLVSAGEYGFDLPYFRRMLESRAVDALQADATRCAGVTGFLRVDALCSAFGVPLSSHTAPSLHLPLVCAAREAVHLEWFHDHARIERMLFDGACVPQRGRLAYDDARPGLGIEFKSKDAECFKTV